MQGVTPHKAHHLGPMYCCIASGMCSAMCVLRSATGTSVLLEREFLVPLSVVRTERSDDSARAGRLRRKKLLYLNLERRNGSGVEAV